MTTTDAAELRSALVNLALAALPFARGAGRQGRRAQLMTAIAEALAVVNGQAEGEPPSAEALVAAYLAGHGEMRELVAAVSRTRINAGRADRPAASEEQP